METEQKQRRKILGVPLTFLVIGVLLVGMGSAALVNYLSVTETSTVGISSPIDFGLYDNNSAELSDQTMKAGEVLEFYKIAKNNADVGIKFAIVTVVQGTNDGILVDSAGPKGDKDTIGAAVVAGTGVWDSTTDWNQVEGEPWYLHGAHNVSTVADYAYLNGAELTDAGFTIVNDKYNDAGGITIDDEDYYIVVFGGTIGDNSASVNTPISETDVITNWGYGGADNYVHRTADIPLVMPTGAYDIGKVRVYFDQSLAAGDYVVKTRVVTPGNTIGAIIEDMFGE